MRTKISRGFYSVCTEDMGQYTDVTTTDYDLIGSVPYGPNHDKFLSDMVDEYFRQREFIAARRSAGKVLSPVTLETDTGIYELSEIVDYEDGDVGEIIILRKKENGDYTRCCGSMFVYEQDVCKHIAEVIGSEHAAIEALLNL